MQPGSLSTVRRSSRHCGLRSSIRRGINGRYNSRVPFHYTAEVLEELRKHGIVPTEATDPQMVRDFLSGLYRYEIRQLKARLVAREFPQRDYASRVRALRRGYVLLSIPLETWTRASDASGAEKARP